MIWLIRPLVSREKKKRLDNDVKGVHSYRISVTCVRTINCISPQPLKMCEKRMGREGGREGEERKEVREGKEDKLGKEVREGEGGRKGRKRR